MDSRTVPKTVAPKGWLFESATLCQFWVRWAIGKPEPAVTRCLLARIGRSTRSAPTRCAGKVALAYTLVLGTSRDKTLGSSNLPARTNFPRYRQPA